MADPVITKDITLRTGFVASHWRLAERSFDDLAGACFIRVSGWKDQAAYDAGNDPAHNYTNTFEGAQYTAVSGKTVAQVETAIVNNVPVFSGGVVS